MENCVFQSLPLGGVEPCLGSPSPNVFSMTDCDKVRVELGVVVVVKRVSPPPPPRPLLPPTPPPPHPPPTIGRDLKMGVGTVSRMSPPWEELRIK